MQFDPFLDSEAPLHPKSAVAAIILVDGDKYLLQHRDPKPDVFFPSHWSFFGGEAEPRETPIGTIRRELDEELGLRLDVDAFRYFTTFHFGMAFAGDHQIERAFYEVRLAGRDIEGLCPREGQGMAAVSARKALSELRMAPYDAFALWMHHSQSWLVF